MTDEQRDKCDAAKRRVEQCREDVNELEWEYDQPHDEDELQITEECLASARSDLMAAEQDLARIEQQFPECRSET
jgi:uncharacterized protein (DUF3084 family)